MQARGWSTTRMPMAIPRGRMQGCTGYRPRRLCQQRVQVGVSTPIRRLVTTQHDHAVTRGYQFTRGEGRDALQLHASLCMSQENEHMPVMGRSPRCRWCWRWHPDAAASGPWGCCQGWQRSAALGTHTHTHTHPKARTCGAKDKVNTSQGRSSG